MKRNLLYSVIIFLLFGIFPKGVPSSDWPIYKGNIYFTGNNDEITVKNSNLKWLFQAEHYVFNPIVSDGMVYFLDLKKNIYCLNEDTGKLVWKINLRSISARFRSYSGAMGKVKYPLIKGNSLFITDNIAIYSINKKTGKVLWARTGMRKDRSMDNIRNWKEENTNRWTPGIGRKSERALPYGSVPGYRNRRYNREYSGSPRWDPGKSSYAVVDSIYSDPVIHNNRIYYGTRNVFISRGISEGHLKWSNSKIKSYSGFPSFYGDYLFTQSMDYSKGIFTLNCIDAGTGKIIWSQTVPKPLKIYSPVVYKGKVYLASGKSLHCFSLKNGRKLWERGYGDYITSNPSFTERAILFTAGNRSLVITDPADGSVKKRLDFGEKSSPYFVTIRDYVYIANTFKRSVGKRPVSFASLKAVRFSDGKRAWEFRPPFPGSSFQPSASKGIIFLPAGNYLYAVGTDYYPRIIEGGSAYYDPYNSIVPDNRKKDTGKTAPLKKKDFGKKKGDKLTFRDVNITLKDKDKGNISGEIEIKKWRKGKIIYSKRVTITKQGRKVSIPDRDNVEITASRDGYVPKKIIFQRKDKDREITLEKIEKGKGIIVDNVYFEIGKAYLKKESLNILDLMIEAMKRNPGIKLEVRGHTDSTGRRAYNVKLSERRADAVVEYMIKNGISPERLAAKGFGPDRPIADNKTRNGRKKNRRTEFFIIER